MANVSSNPTHSPDFDIEYYTENATLSNREKSLIEHRMNKLTKGHRDISGASVAVECISGDNKRAEYKARLVVYCKPANIVGSSTHQSIYSAVTDALEAIERQVRDQRERMRDRHRTARQTQ
ncbi:MAG: ribosome-associated translation inhibitor RaiA [Bacteroidetes bacterium]|nr:ribosome-associated translation inhibitor RaiA [Bacteroidota bacterium]